MSFLPFSALLSWSHLFSALLMSPELSHLFSSHLSLSQLFSDFHSFFSALRSSCQLMLCLLISSLLFSHLLSSSHISWADLSSCQLVSPHFSSSQRTLKSSQLFSSPRPAPKNGSRRQSKRPLHIWHREAFPHSKLFHREACAQGSFYTEQALTQKPLQRSFYTQQTFTHRSFYTQKLLHGQAFTQRSIYTQRAFTLRSFYTEKPLRREALTHSTSFHTENLLHREAFAQLLHTASLYTALKHSKPSHREAPTQKSLYTEKLLHTESFYTQKLLHREAFTQLLHRHAHRDTQRHSKSLHSFFTQQALRCPAAKHIVLRTQPWHQATLTQPLQCDLQRLSCKTQ